MTKKYEFTGKFKHIKNVVVHQIRRLSDGQVGGWIEKEENLSHAGECWVADDAVVCNEAKVFGNAMVTGYAMVSDTAQVFEKAQVFGRAQVFCNAKVSGEAWVAGIVLVMDDAEVFGKARVTGYVCISGTARVSRTPIFAFLGRHQILIDDNNLVSIGCDQHSLEYWLKHYRKIGTANNYSKQEIKRYGAFLKFLKQENGGGTCKVKFTGYLLHIFNTLRRMCLRKVPIKPE